ncbi:MAG: PHP domain-containing protein [Cyanobacteria bacterium P01_E01_bin.42]
MLELHAHTTYSDGTLAPAALVKAAFQAGVRALAITDHDTLGGWEEAFEAASHFDVEIVPGVELSTVHRDRSLHLLGFYPDADKLSSHLQRFVAGRKRRAEAIADKLAALGYPIQLPELGAGVAPSRPHIARALVDAGHAHSVREAFDRWLHDDGSAYVPYEKFSAREGIQLLRDCGGIAVWAHPYLFRGGDIEEVLQELTDGGLQGVEVYHPSHTPSQRQHLEARCRKLGLIMTGGSDYHGPSLHQGIEETRLNQLQLPLSLLESLKQSR